MILNCCLPSCISKRALLLISKLSFIFSLEFTRTIYEKIVFIKTRTQLHTILTIIQIFCFLRKFRFIFKQIESSNVNIKLLKISSISILLNKKLSYRGEYTKIIQTNLKLINMEETDWLQVESYVRRVV